MTDRQKLNTGDTKMQNIQREIDRLNGLKARRAAELADPKRQEIRQAWDDLAMAMSRLDDLGEDVADANGDAPYLTGKAFGLSSDNEIIEG